MDVRAAAGIEGGLRLDGVSPGITHTVLPVRTPHPGAGCAPSGRLNGWSKLLAKVVDTGAEHSTAISEASVRLGRILAGG
ncbi:hypothetical protein [Streptomyces sp. NPDC019224]|uniref:hypothetical protein n=1 Tax=Streptomyces sp. NPDC019224 TaxID=3154484 RepID=UPI0033DE3D89